MPCDVGLGRLLGCSDAVGGLKRVYFVNEGDITVTLDIDGQTITSLGTGLTSAYQYDLHLGNSLTQNIQKSEANGTTYYEQVLALTLKKMTAADNVELQNIIKGKFYVIVEDNMEQKFLVGLKNLARVTGGTAVSGDAMADLNGYTLSISAEEPSLANFYTGAVATDFTVVTGV